MQKITGNEPALNIRQEFAARAMQTILADYLKNDRDSPFNPPDRTFQSYARESVMMADALIAELNK